MANRLETFKTLTATYREEIAKLEASIKVRRHRVDQLRAELEAEETAIRREYDDRSVTIEQMRGIETVIRSMEDREREQRIADEIRATEARRKLEDQSYADV